MDLFQDAVLLVIYAFVFARVGRFFIGASSNPGRSPKGSGSERAATFTLKVIGWACLFLSVWFMGQSLNVYFNGAENVPDDL